MATLRQMWLLLFTVTCAYHYVISAKESQIVSAEEKIRSEIFSGYSILQRPVSNLSESIMVSMSMGLANMHSFIEKEQISSYTAYLQLRWMDQRLKWDPADYDDIELIPVSPSEVWLPKLTVFNAVSQEGINVVDKDIGQILLKSDGELNLAMAVQQTIMCSVRVLYFPFDKQVCPIIFGFPNLPQSLGRLEIFGSYLLPFQSTSQWNITSLTGEITTFILPNITSTEEFGFFSIALFCIHFERDPSYYIATLLIPSTCLCLLAFMTFLAPPDSGERLSVSVSMVLGLTVFQLLMYDLLPISDEQSLLSIYLSTNFILVALTVPFSLMNMNLAYGDRNQKVLNKKWFRVLALEFLPKLLFVPSLSQKNPQNKILPQKLTLEDVAGDEFSQQKPELAGNVTVISQNRNPHKDDHDRQMGMLESRIFAVVCDRLMFLALVIVLAVRAIRLTIDYSGQTSLSTPCL